MVLFHYINPFLVNALQIKWTQAQCRMTTHSKYSVLFIGTSKTALKHILEVKLRTNIGPNKRSAEHTGGESKNYEQLLNNTECEQRWPLCPLQECTGMYSQLLSAMEWKVDINIFTINKLLVGPSMFIWKLDQVLKLIQQLNTVNAFTTNYEGLPLCHVLSTTSTFRFTIVIICSCFYTWCLAPKIE